MVHGSHAGARPWLLLHQAEALPPCASSKLVSKP